MERKTWYAKRIAYGRGVAEFKGENSSGMWFTTNNHITNAFNWKKIGRMEYLFLKTVLPIINFIKPPKW